MSAMRYPNQFACLLLTGLPLFLSNPVLALTLPPREENVLDRAIIAQVYGTARYEKLRLADDFYQQGNLQAAARIQREVKPAFTRKVAPPARPFSNIEDLEPAAVVYWRNANEGMEQDLESKIFGSLELLTENYPDFIPGHLLLVDALLKYDRAEEAVAAIERASTIHPDQIDILDKKIELLAAQERYLEAAIAARQFAISYPDHPQADQYLGVAEEYQERYRQYLQEETQGNIIATTVSSWFTGNKKSAEQVIRFLEAGEAQTGQMMSEQYLQELSLVEDPQMNEYVTSVGEKLADLMGRSEFEYEFFIVDSPDPNAFALPGGKIFINQGLLKLLGTEAELAGILAHELAHTVLSHGFQDMATASVRETVEVIPLVGGTINDLETLTYNRRQEQEADQLATRIIATAGYAADGLHTVTTLFNRLDSDSTPPWLRSHPAPEKRVGYLEELIVKNGYNRYAYEGVASYQEVFGEPAIAAASATPPNSEPTANPQEQFAPATISLAQVKSDVEVRLEGGSLDSPGYAIEVAIVNNTDKVVRIIPGYVKVRDDRDQVVRSDFQFLENQENFRVEPGKTRKAKLHIMGATWQYEESQNLTVIIRESLGRARIFRIPF